MRRTLAKHPTAAFVAALASLLALVYTASFLCGRRAGLPGRRSGRSAAQAPEEKTGAAQARRAADSPPGAQAPETDGLQAAAPQTAQDRLAGPRVRFALAPDGRLDVQFPCVLPAGQAPEAGDDSACRHDLADIRQVAHALLDALFQLGAPHVRIQYVKAAFRRAGHLCREIKDAARAERGRPAHALELVDGRRTIDLLEMHNAPQRESAALLAALKRRAGEVYVRWLSLHGSPPGFAASTRLFYAYSMSTKGEVEVNGELVRHSYVWGTAAGQPQE